REKEVQKKENKRKKVSSPKTSQKDLPAVPICAEGTQVPVFIQACVNYIEKEGLQAEGIYRVPGNRAQGDLLFQKLDEQGVNFTLDGMEVPINAVATALKDFFGKRLPPIVTPDIMEFITELTDKFADKNLRLFALRDQLKKLPSQNFEILKYIFNHFVKVCKCSRQNSMDSRNLAICWWPTLLPYDFNDMSRFERMRPNLEDTVQTMIDQYSFIFCGEEEVMMV
ncbi:unnamed protein product, partial [Cyprideis torosa]